MSCNFGVTIIGPEDTGPLRPRVVATSRAWGLGKKLKVGNGLGTVAHGGSDTIVTSISTADNDDVLASSIDVVAVRELGVQERLSVQLQETWVRTS